MLTEPVPLNLPDVSLRLYVHEDRDAVISPQLRERGIWEPYETELVRELLSPGNTFVDVGANLGYFTVIAAAAVGAGGKVYAFEPDAANATLLRANVALNALPARVQVEQAGLAAADGMARLYLNPTNLGDHQLFPDEAGREHMDVRLLDGGTYLESAGVRAELVKIDTQGAESAVMDGLLPWLLGHEHVPTVLIELTPFSLRGAGRSGRELIQQLARLEQPFWIVDHLQHRLHPTTAAELAQWCDNVDACVDDRGFMNILVGDAPVATVDEALV